MIASLQLVFAIIAVSSSFCRGFKICRHVSLKTSINAAMDEKISSVHDDVFNLLKKDFELKLTDFTSSYGLQTWNYPEGKASGESEWWDEVKGSKLTGISRTKTVQEKTSTTDLSVWLGPLTSVPHLRLSLISNNENIELIADYIPRGSSALGTDVNYFQKYFETSELIALHSRLHAASGSVSTISNFYDRLLRSPNFIHVSADSSSSLKPDEIIECAKEHVARWIKWVQESPQVESRQRALLNSRDDKLRQYFFAFNLYRAKKVFHDNKSLQNDIAAAWTGPIAEAYVGGGS